MRIPSGFPEFIQFIIEDWNWDTLAKTEEIIWDQLFYTVFLSEDVKSAESHYAKELMNNHISWDNAEKAVSDADWSKKALKTLEVERSTIMGRPGEGYKKKIINRLESQVKKLMILESMNDTLRFIEDNNINPAKIASLVGNRNKQIEIVILAKNNISNVGLIKSVLWMYGCGIGREIAPPNNHVLNFLDECKIPGYSWADRKTKETTYMFTPVCQRIREISDEVERELSTKISVKQTQSAIWYLQTTRGLITQPKIKSKINPRSLLRFLESMSWNINTYSDNILDVEKLDNLINELKSFFK